ncbi:beta-phosphoglucomutase [Cohnella cholangitidis]|uniref:Beta-phosphoglucomutase n=1 Tax=Cohnella cholangitidis TaxID=2598458 RepID=A0A7G5C485_9BACL|nr:beta-phosphoglucomutase [Cohnella cholangitidis]QMV44019.1 beta-phosphoglucomutase [Cohnella cholangitidis]
MNKLPKAIIFDLDGVITDTAEYHFLAWKQLAEELGVTIDREFNEMLKGVSRIESLTRILALNPTLANMSEEEKNRLAAKKNEHYKSYIARLSPKDVLPGVKPLIKKLKKENLKLAIGSASKNAPEVLKRLDLEETFDYVVDAARISKGKPDPETFTNAADYFGVSYEHCIGIEDSAAGIQAINAAGMFSVGIGNAADLFEANYLIDTTAELNYEAIILAYNQS